MEKALSQRPESLLRFGGGGTIVRAKLRHYSGGSVSIRSDPIRPTHIGGTFGALFVQLFCGCVDAYNSIFMAPVQQNRSLQRRLWPQSHLLPLQRHWKKRVLKKVRQLSRGEGLRWLWDGSMSLFLERVTFSSLVFKNIFIYGGPYFSQCIHILAFLDGPISKGDEKPRSLHPDYIKLYLVMLHHFVIIFILALALIFSRLPCVRPLGLRLHLAPPYPAPFQALLLLAVIFGPKLPPCGVRRVVLTFFFLSPFFEIMTRGQANPSAKFVFFSSFVVFFPSVVDRRPCNLIEKSSIVQSCIWNANYKLPYQLQKKVLKSKVSTWPHTWRVLNIQETPSPDPGFWSPTWCLFTHKSVTANNSENCWHANSNQPCKLTGEVSSSSYIIHLVVGSLTQRFLYK